MLLGEFLIQKKLITKEQLDQALEEQKSTGEFLGVTLVKKMIIREDDLMKALSEQFQMPCVSLKNSYIDWAAAMKFSTSLVTEKKCLPIRHDDSGFTVAITNPLDALAISQAEDEAKTERVHLVLVTPTEMQGALLEYKKRLNDKIKKAFD